MKLGIIQLQIQNLKNELELYKAALRDIAQFGEGDDGKLCSLIAKLALKEGKDVRNQVQKIASGS